MLEIFDHFQRLAWCNNLIKIPGMVEKKNRLRQILAGNPGRENSERTSGFQQTH